MFVISTLQSELDVLERLKVWIGLIVMNRSLKIKAIFSSIFLKSVYLLLKLKEMFQCKKNWGSPNSFAK